VRRVGILLKRGKPEAVEIARQLTPFLTGAGHRAFLCGDDDLIPGAERVDENELAECIDLLLVLGGDGTLLHGAGLVAAHGVPLLGVNLGHLGFLTYCAPSDAKPALERALKGELPIEERLRLRCVLTRAQPSSEGPLIKFACNDAVVSQGALARLIELETLLEGQPITRYRADGLIVSTPTGSTAYNLAAGGPIVTPDVRAVVITPICPHTLTNRPVVAPASSRISIRVTAPSEHVMLTIDGQWATRFDPGDTLEISQAAPPLYLYRPSESHFDVLRRKLHWGER
jgi:NAD+ kinase